MDDKREDWKKYNKEMRDLTPILNAEDMKKERGSRIYKPNGKLVTEKPIARIIGKKGELLFSEQKVKEMEVKAEEELKKKAKARPKIPGYDSPVDGMAMHQLKRIQRMAPIVSKNKQRILNRWFEENMRATFPKWVLKIIEINKKIPWFLSFIKPCISHEQTPLPWGTDFVSIRLFGKPIVSQAFVWED